MEHELTPEEAEILRTSVSRGYTPKREVTEPDEPPTGSAGTSQAAED
ncbi:hypothetical protein ACWEKJ_11280 [Amycolatopsis thermoflava]